MSTDDIDMAAVERHVEQYAKQKRRGWFRRNWRWFVPALLLTIVVVGGGALYWALFIRVYNLEVCQSAMRTIGADKGMQESLGQPIKNVLWPSQESMPSFRIEKEEIDIRWSIVGSKGQVARAHLFAKRRQGKWDTVVLEVTPTGGKKVSVREAGDTEGDAPIFQGANPKPPKPQGKKPETKSADINIDLPIPSGEAPAGAK